MDPRVATILKLAVFGLIALVAFGYGSKHYKRHARKCQSWPDRIREYLRNGDPL